jgi:hypothetical protein
METPIETPIEVPYFINMDALLPITIVIPIEPDSKVVVLVDETGSVNLEAVSLIDETGAVNLDEIKCNIESTVNFSSVNEGLDALRTPDLLKNRIQGAFDSFKKQVGRNMTYSEMREMMG